MSSTLAETIVAIRAGSPVIVPTDTVYGLACTPHEEEPVRLLSRLKGRDEGQPIALVVADLDLLLSCLPEIRGRSALLARTVLPGPYTLVLPNPAGRFPWLAGESADTIGVRVPALEDGPARTLLQRAGALAATSANLHGGADPRRLEDVDPELRAGVAAALDGGQLPGRPSTVIDCSRGEPVVLREGVASGAEAVARLRAALAGRRQ